MPASVATVPAKKVLQLHRVRKQYRGFSGTTEKDFSAELLFSIRQEGARPTTFWCEVQLRRDLLVQPRWKALSRGDRLKAMYLLAVDAIRNAGGRPVRQVSIGWFTDKPWSSGPDQDLASIDLKRPAPVILEGPGFQPVVVEQH